MLDENGKPYAVYVTDHTGFDNQVDINYYEDEGYQPDWRTLKPCPGTGPKKP
jgi:hypothetical protein